VLVPFLAGIVGLATLPLAGIYASSEWKIRRPYDAPLVPLRAREHVDLAEGERMARIVGCLAGCHGPDGEGGREQIAGIVRHTAPTLSDVLPRYSDAELVRLIRYGVKRDGRSAVGMISYTFWPLGDEDLADIIARLRRLPRSPPVPRELDLTIRGRLALATGDWKVSAAQVDRTIPRWGELPRTRAFERGRYLASVTCAECHGLDFRGNALERAPSLAVVAAYAPGAFRHLLRTGEALGGRDLGLMSRVSRNAFSLFTDEEISDIYIFLRGHHGLDALVDEAAGPQRAGGRLGRPVDGRHTRSARVGNFAPARAPADTHGAIRSGLRSALRSVIHVRQPRT
jgi:cytochrome c553